MKKTIFDSDGTIIRKEEIPKLPPNRNSEWCRDCENVIHKESKFCNDTYYGVEYNDDCKLGEDTQSSILTQCQYFKKEKIPDAYFAPTLCEDCKYWGYESTMQYLPHCKHGLNENRELINCNLKEIC